MNFHLDSQADCNYRHFLHLPKNLQAFWCLQQRILQRSVRFVFANAMVLALLAIFWIGGSSALWADDDTELPYINTTLAPGENPFAATESGAEASGDSMMTARRNDESITLYEGDPKQLLLVDERKGKMVFDDCFFDAKGSSYVSWGNGTNDMMGIAKVSRDGSIKTVVPIAFDTSTGKSRFDNFSSNVKQGKLWFYSGPAAIDRNGDFYISLGQCSPNAIIRYDSKTKRFDPMVRIDSCRGLNIYDFDPEAFYVTSEYKIHRLVFSVSAASNIPFIATLHLALRGKQPETIRESQAITADRWLVSLKNVESMSYRTLLIDLKSRSFHNVPQLDKWVRMGINKAGDLVCLSGYDVLTFKLDGLSR